MTMSIEAIYEGGVFRPTRQISLTDGTHVEVLVPLTASARDPKMVAAKLAQVAAQATGWGQPESASVDHDEILYGNRNRA